MPFAQIAEAQTTVVTISGNRTITLQEWPSLPALRFTKFMAELVRTILSDLKKSGQDVRKLQWKVPALDDKGAQVWQTDAATGESVAVTTMNYDLMLELLCSAADHIADAHAHLVSAIDAAQVSGCTNFDAAKPLLFGDLLKLLRGTLEVNFARESSLGNALWTLMDSASPQGNQSSMGSSPTPNAVPTQPPKAPPV